MNRMTHERCSGIKKGYWSPDKKEDLVQRLAAYENTGLEPEVMAQLGWRLCSHELPVEYGGYLVTMSIVGYHDGALFINCFVWDPEESQWIDDGGDLVAGDGVEIIAWMPLPEPYRINL